MFPATTSTASSMADVYMTTVKEAAFRKDKAEQAMVGPKPTRRKEIEAWKENMIALWGIKSSSIQSVAEKEIDDHIEFVLAKLPAQIRNMPVKEFRRDVESPNPVLLKYFRTFKISDTQQLGDTDSSLHNSKLYRSNVAIPSPRTKSPSGYTVARQGLSGLRHVEGRALDFSTQEPPSAGANSERLRKRGISTVIGSKVQKQLKSKSQDIILPDVNEFAHLDQNKQTLIVDILNAVLDTYEDELSSKSQPPGSGNSSGPNNSNAIYSQANSTPGPGNLRRPMGVSPKRIGLA